MKHRANQPLFAPEQAASAAGPRIALIGRWRELEIFVMIWSSKVPHRRRRRRGAKVLKG